MLQSYGGYVEQNVQNINPNYHWRVVIYHPELEAWLLQTLMIRSMLINFYQPTTMLQFVVCLIKITPYRTFQQLTHQLLTHLIMRQRAPLFNNKGEGWTCIDYEWYPPRIKHGNELASIEDSPRPWERPASDWIQKSANPK